MNNYSSIILTDYQLNSVHKIKNKHGLLLWWSMGSGKTIAGITFALNFKNYKINVLCPKNIRFIWENEFNKIGKIHNVRYYSYENLESFAKKENMKGEIIIIDEAHNLIYSIISKNMSVKSIISLLGTCEKVLLLSGTPMYKDYMDIVYLINIAAGKTVLPYNNSEFRKLYYKEDKFKKAFYGYYKPIVVNINEILKMSTIFIKLTHLEIFQIINIPPLIKNIGNRLYEVLEFFSVDGVMNNIRSFTHTIDNKYIVLSIYVILLVNMYIYITKNLYEYKINEIKYFDTEKFANIIEPYVSVYKNPSDRINFPEINIETKYSPYNSYQMAMWISLTQDELSIDTIKKLNMTTIEDVEYYAKKINIKEYLNKGTSIGNLNNGKEFSPKFYKILEISSGKRTVIYSSFLNNGINQFRDFLDNYKISYLYLDVDASNDEKNKILSKFKGSTTFLLLHPSYSEGISIYGAEQFHLMEPVDSYSKREQVISRVARYDSHLHLSPKRRKVDIYQWVCETKTILSKMNKIKISIQKWLQLNSEILYTKNYLKFDQNMTPDSIVLKKVKQYKNVNDDIIKNLISVQKNEKIDCCINFLSDEQFSDCMDKYDKKC